MPASRICFARISGSASRRSGWNSWRTQMSLLLAGINTHACIRMTAIDAYQRDWQVVLAADCIDSYDREHHEISLRYMRGKIAAVMSNDEIRTTLGRAG